MKKNLIAALLLLAALPVQAQDAATLQRAVALLKKVPPHATLGKLKPLLPRGCKLGARQVSTQGPGKTWIVQPFSGTLQGQFVFFNARQTPPHKKGAPPPPPFAGANKMLLATDSVHYVEIFLGAAPKTFKKGALTTRTKRYVDALTRRLGKPAFRENTGEEGGPDAIGWTANWKLAGRRQISFIESFALLSSDERPLLTLDWPYSKIYQS